MRRTAALLVCLAAALAALAPSAHAAGARLVPSAGQFPLRAFVLTLPTHAAADPSTVDVRENGQPVERLSVTPGNGRFAVLLLIDASTSMRGVPIAGAMAAARAFAQQRPAAQSLGVITFNRTATVVARPTSDGAALDRALAPTPQVVRGTHIYDALDSALGLIDPRRFDAAAMVVLSDGHDYGSTTPLEEVADKAQEAHARLFTVGLRSKSFDPTTLQAIARAGNGEYLGAASPQALAKIYQALGDQLANAYVIRYMSTAPAGTPVTVTAAAAGEQASVAYTAPKLQIPGAVDTALRKTSRRHPAFLASRTGALVVSLAVLALVLVGLGSWLPQRASRSALRSRISAYGEHDGVAHHDVEPVVVTPQSRIREKAWFQRLDEALDIARIHMSPARFLAYTTVGTVTAVFLTNVLLGNPFLTAFVFVIGPLSARTILRRQVAMQRRLFADQLADSIQTVTSSMRTGHSFVGALAQLVEGAQEPTASEFRRLVADERLGVPLDVALENVVRRMDNRDLEQVGLVTVIQRETGGNGAEALDRVVGNIRARDEIRRLVRALTAQGRLSQVVLTALPFGTAVALKLLGGKAMDPLFNTGWGHAMLLLAAVLCAIGGFWIGRIVTVKV